MPTIQEINLSQEHQRMLINNSLSKLILEEIKNSNEKCNKCNRNGNYLNKEDGLYLCWNHSIN